MSSKKSKASKTSKARRRANRLNAQKSTGPKTQAGKEVSRGNALQHGHAAKVVPHPDDAKAVAEGRDAFAAAYPSAAPEAKAHYALAALTCAQIERMHADDLKDLDTRQKEAREEATNQRMETFRELTKMKGDDAHLASDRLEQIPEGVRWKRDAWCHIGYEIENGFPLTVVMVNRMFALMGLDRDPDRRTLPALQIWSFYMDAGGEVPEGKLKDPALPITIAGRAWLRNLAETEWNRLNALLPEVTRKAEEKVADAVRRAQIDTSPRGKTIQRYLTSSGLTLVRTMKTIHHLAETFPPNALAAPEPQSTPAPEPKTEPAAPAASPCESNDLNTVTERTQAPPPPVPEPTPITPETDISTPPDVPNIRTEPNAD